LLIVQSIEVEMIEQGVRRVSFQGGGEAKLAGVLHLPDGESGCAVLITHCFTCSKDYRIIVRLARFLAEAGTAVLRFDFTGLGESEGDFRESSISTDIADIKAAARWLASQGLGSCVLVGHSLGGAASLLAAAQLTEAAAVAVIGTPSDTEHVSRLFPKSEKRTDHGLLEVTIAGRNFKLNPSFLEELQKHSLREAVSRLRRPFLVLHGTEDRVVSIEEGEKLFAAAHQPKSFIALEGADHLLTDPSHLASAGEFLRSWLKTMFLAGSNPQAVQK
jgi:alpha/beta superfamily hydrolase